MYLDNFKNFYSFDNLSREEEIRIFQEMGEGVNVSLNRDRLVESHLKLVLNIAKKYSNVDSTYHEDIVLDGTLGLIEAIDKFDVEQNNRFATYAIPYIRHAIQRSLRKNLNQIHIPNRKIYEALKLKKYIAKTESDTGHSPDISDMCLHMEKNPEQIENLLFVLEIFEQKNMNKDEHENCDVTIDPDCHEKIDQEHVEVVMMEKIAELPELDRVIFQMRYGLDGCDSMTWRQIGSRLDLSYECVRQRHNKCLEAIKADIAQSV